MSCAVFFSMFRLILFEMLLMMFCYFQITKPMPVCISYDCILSVHVVAISEELFQPERDEKFVVSRSDRFGSWFCY